MADRYWVGGTANWDATAGTKWATTSGGAGGAAVPTSADDVYFDAASGAVTVTVTSGVNCAALNFTGFTGTFTGNVSVNVYGSATISATTTWSHTGSLIFRGGGSRTLTSSGKAITGGVDILSSTTLSLSDALTTGTIGLTSGTFTTNDYNVTATILSSSNSNTRTINLGSSTVTLNGSGVLDFVTTTNLTFNAGTSSIIFSAANPTFNGGSQTFYNVSFTATNSSLAFVRGANTFNDVAITGRISAGIFAVQFFADQTINGTLTLSAGGNATARTFVRSNTIGTTRTLTCAAVDTLTDIDFRDITIAGAAAPVSGTRLGDCKGNSGITFDAAKTVYWRNATAANWGATTWSATNGGTADVTQFPLAQDTAIFPSGYPNSGVTVTVNAAYNIGTIDMSARTSNTMTLSCSQSPGIYGDWINGTGTTLSGAGLLTFAGRGSQTITSAGKTFTQPLRVETPGGSVTFQDAFSSSNNGTHISGVLDTNGYSATLASLVLSQVSVPRTLDIGSSTITLTSSFTYATSAPSTVFTGTGTISMTRATAKTFAGGGAQTYPTLNQGGTGTLTITGSNKFADITNTAIGRVQFTGGTTNEFTAFNLNGVSGNLLQVGSTDTTQATLKAPSWNVGANSTDAGNNTGLTFSAGSVDYLSISYVNGEIVAGPTSSIYYGAANITAIYYGSTPVSAIYYGATQVF